MRKIQKLIEKDVRPKCFESKPHSKPERVSRFHFLLIFLAKTANPDITSHIIQINLKHTNGTKTNYPYWVPKNYHLTNNQDFSNTFIINAPSPTSFSSFFRKIRIQEFCQNCSSLKSSKRRSSKRTSLWRLERRKKNTIKLILLFWSYYGILRPVELKSTTLNML